MNKVTLVTIITAISCIISSNSLSQVTVSTHAGTGIQGFTDGDALTQAQFQATFGMGVCVDNNGAVYVADRDNHAIRKIAGGIVTTLAGNGTPGFADPANAHEICISHNAVLAHLAHGDYLGPCLDTSSTDSLNQQPQFSKVFLTAYPNPLSQKTTITFSLPEPGDVTLAIYYSNCLDIAKLLDGYAEANVIYSVQFDAGNLASGMYFYQLITQTGTYTKKLVIIK